MIVIKRIKNILFFLLIGLLIIFLLSKLGLISFFVGLIKSLFPLFIGLFISVCFEPVIRKFINKGLKRKYVVIFSYLSLLSVLSLIVLLFIPPFITQIKIFLETLPSLINDLGKVFYKFGIKINSENVLSLFQIKFDSIIDYLSSGFNILVSTGIAISSAFFISYDYDIIKKKMKEFIPNIIKKETIYFFSKYEVFFSKYIYSLIIDSIITFIISFVLFTIFSIEYSLVGALIITITNLIPFIGPLLGVIPLGVIGYSVSMYASIISVVIVLLVQLVESNIMQPLIFKNVIKLHPVEVLIGIMVFSYLFSIFGVIFSPLLVVAFKLLFIEKYPLKESPIESESIQ